MNIAVIAANGRLGSAFVEAALRAGHSVRAGVHGRHSLAPHPKLEVVPCDATKQSDVERLLRGQDVVVSTIGHVAGSSLDVQTVATQCIVAAMDKAGIRRFVDVTGTGVRFPGDKITLFDRVANLGVSLVDGGRIKDGRRHQEVLAKSDVDWTTIRVLKLQNTLAKPYALKLHGPTKWYVSRAEVALAMLQVIEKQSFIRQAPIVGKVV